MEARNRSYRPHQISRTRVVALGLLMGAAMLTFLVHLFSIQIIDGTIYQLRARQTSRRSVVIPAVRGEIFDRNADIPISTNVDSFAVDVIPADVPQERYPDVISRLAARLDTGAEEIRRRIEEFGRNRFQPVVVKDGVGLETISYIAEHIEDYPGVTWHRKPIRSYPFADQMTHLLGYVGDINAEELQILFNRGYTSNSIVGKAGAELQFEHILRGEDGRDFFAVDARGRRISDEEFEDVPPESGSAIVLTIDRDIQALAQRALGERVGSVVVLKPETGEVLALVSWPTYDPNLLYTERGSALLAELNLDPASPFLNRGIQSAAAPASTFKIIMTAAAIEEEVLDTDDIINARLEYRFGNGVWRDWGNAAFGPLDIFGGLANSSNYFFYVVGNELLGYDRIAHYAREFGFGTPTGIDLPGEVAGLIPTPEWKERRLGEPWVGGDTVNMSIGQGFVLVTPLQMANAVAMVANSGLVYRPHVLKEVRDPTTGAVTEQTEPELLYRAQIRDSSFDVVQRAMRTVITDGTAHVVITTDAVEVAGKTGTGQIGVEDQYHSWFAAYAPYEVSDPRDRVVVVVMVDAVNEWEWWAPIAANIIIHGIFTDQDYDDTLRDLQGLRNPWFYYIED